MRGKLYGIGVGPGDPSLLTLQAKKRLEEVDYVFIPVKKIGEDSKAFGIVEQVITIPEEKVIPVIFAMKRDRKEQEKGWELATKQIAAYLEQGKSGALITLGDVSIYSTAFYVCDRLKKAGYDTEMVAGIPSFCAGASLAGISLVEGKESLMVIPSLKGIEQIKQVLPFFDNLVIMKASRFISEIETLLEEQEETMTAYVMSQVGMEGEYIGPLDSKREYEYLTTVVIKKESNDTKEQ